MEDVETILRREPFAPLKLLKVNGQALDIPFRHAAVVLRGQGLLIFKGVKSATSRQAKSYEVVAFDRIDRIEQRPVRGSGGRRKKAS